MSFRDLLDIAAGNLWRIRLRAILTISGVIIAIATFVSMLSFAAGNQKYITDSFSDFGLFTRMKVFPENERDDNDTIPPAVLDRNAVARLSEVPGVALVYPFMSFNIEVSIADTHFTTEARVLPHDAVETRLYARVFRGNNFSSDTANEVIVAYEFYEMTGFDSPDSLLGKQIIISAKSMSLDSALINVVDDKDKSISRRLDDIDPDSLYVKNYRERFIRRELNEGVKRFTDGLMTRQMTISDTLVIKAVGEHFPAYNLGMTPVIITEKTARRFSSGGLGIGADPINIVAAMRNGALFEIDSVGKRADYPQVTLEIDPYASYKKVKDSIQAMGFRVFSFAEQFDEFQRFYIYFYAGLGIIGLIALVTASLGIVNTMVMSIMERRREIGVIKSLGADEKDIRLMFLCESAIIGMIGSVIGIFCGWAATRIVSIIMQTIMRREEMLVFDPFALPVWLILTALLFGLMVSLAAGFYPASRASRVDPVEALRAE